MNIDILFSFDTTGSMSPVIHEVRQRLEYATKRLLGEIPGLRIGFIAHGDYCDKRTSYVTKECDFTSDPGALVSFVNGVGNTCGGDYAECYEYVMYQALRMNWYGDRRIFVMVGDAYPHSQHETQNTLHLDWREQLSQLTREGMEIYAVQCLKSRSGYESDAFWQAVANSGNGCYVELAQFSDIIELIIAICYKQVSDDAVRVYEDEIATSGLMNRRLAAIFDQVMGREGDVRKSVAMYTPTSLHAVPPDRFQLLRVDTRTPIKSFVEMTGARFKIGRGFYQFTKTEMVQENKEVVLVDKKTGDMYTGAYARELLGLPYGMRGKISPSYGNVVHANGTEYNVFIQSTSANRVLMPNTMFLYETM